MEFFGGQHVMSLPLLVIPALCGNTACKISSMHHIYRLDTDLRNNSWKALR